jgi:3'-phosphoadenosine 5'-phosphosulfate sulfotransferase (PAPS reductase)/FAD synthetase
MKKLKFKYITGERIGESSLRKQRYHTCILPNKCIPLRIWTDEMCSWYINKYNLNLSEIYTKYGYPRTGCFACMYGVHLEKSPNRFETMKITHPKLYKFCIEYLNLKKPLDILKVKY